MMGYLQYVTVVPLFYRRFDLPCHPDVDNPFLRIDRFYLDRTTLRIINIFHGNHIHMDYALYDRAAEMTFILSRRTTNSTHCLFNESLGRQESPTFFYLY
jgi:hypothetical protein